MITEDLCVVRRAPSPAHPTIVALIAVAIAVFLYEQSSAPNLGHDFGAVPSEISSAWNELLEGGWDTRAAAVLLKTVSPLFLHADIQHIVLNMVFLWVFGTLASEHLGNGGRWDCSS